MYIPFGSLSAPTLLQRLNYLTNNVKTGNILEMKYRTHTGTLQPGRKSLVICYEGFDTCFPESPHESAIYLKYVNSKVHGCENLPNLLGAEFNNVSSDDLSFLNSMVCPKLQMLTIHNMWKGTAEPVKYENMRKFLSRIDHLKCLDISNNKFKGEDLAKMFTREDGTKIKITHLLIENCTGVSDEDFDNILKNIDTEYLETISIGTGEGKNSIFTMGKLKSVKNRAIGLKTLNLTGVRIDVAPAA